jgi:opacity protein-like surface antigen
MLFIIWKGQVKIVMRKIGLVGFAVLLFAGLASAQVPTSANVFFGYSYYNTNLSSIDRANTNGWELSVEGKVIPWVGIVADFDSHYGSQNFVFCPAPPVVGPPCAVFNASVTERNFLFGPRASVSVGKFRPFAEALFGGAHVSINNGGGSDTSFATALGGGVDYKIIRPVAWRFQGDYVQTRFFGTTQNNVRLSTGIVLRF